MIIGFGDSHIFYTLCRLRSAGIFWLGPVTMHRFGRDGIDTLGEYRKHIGLHDTIVFAFGEIDIRCHVKSQAQKKGLDPLTVIHQMVEGYMRTVRRITASFFMNRFVISCVMPPANSSTLENPAFPFIGTTEERVIWTRYANNLLKDQSKKLGAAYWDFYDLTEDRDGSLNPAISDGTVHIHPIHTEAILQRLPVSEKYRVLKNFDQSLLSPRVVQPNRNWYDKTYNSIIRLMF